MIDGDNIDQSQYSQMFQYLHTEIDKRTRVNGITPIDMLSLPNPLNNLFDKIMRQGSLSLTEVAEEVQTNATEAKELANLLINKGYLRLVEKRSDNEIIYQIRFAAKRKRRVPPKLWQALSD